jgi:hypothetical protein
MVFHTTTDIELPAIWWQFEDRENGRTLAMRATLYAIVFVADPGLSIKPALHRRRIWVGLLSFAALG